MLANGNTRRIVVEGGRRMGVPSSGTLGKVRAEAGEIRNQASLQVWDLV